MNIDKLVILDLLSGLSLSRKLLIFNPNNKSLDVIESVVLHGEFYQLNIEKDLQYDEKNNS